MKKIINILLGIWCAITCFVTPIWITMIILNITGMIYQYDYSMDEGTAGIIGVVLLLLWIGLAFVPNVYLGKKLYVTNIKYFLCYGICVAVLCALCFAMCNWDIMGVLVM